MLQISILLTALSLMLAVTSLTIRRPAASRITSQTLTLQSLRLLQWLQKKRLEGRRQAMLAELKQTELFIARMLKCGVYSVHEILGVAADYSVKLAPVFRRCYSRYFYNGTSAIEEMKQELPDNGFTVLCDALIYASSFGRQEMAAQVEDHLKQLSQMQSYKRQQTVSQKETRFVFTMILPLAAFIIVQIYPWLIQATQQLGILW